MSLPGTPVARDAKIAGVSTSDRPLLKNGMTRVVSRGVTIRYPHDTIRIAILESRYDTYRDTW